MIKTMSLETAKKLKEAGFPQESAFYWIQDFDGGYRLGAQDYIKHKIAIAAPTAEEVLDEIKGKIQIERYEDGSYSVYWVDSKMNEFSESYLAKDKTLREAAAKMYLYLAEKGLLGK